jgi:hypothetical protein
MATLTPDSGLFVFNSCESDRQEGGPSPLRHREQPPSETASIFGSERASHEPSVLWSRKPEGPYPSPVAERYEGTTRWGRTGVRGRKLRLGSPDPDAIRGTTISIRYAVVFVEPGPEERGRVLSEAHLLNSAGQRGRHTIVEPIGFYIEFCPGPGLGDLCSLDRFVSASYRTARRDHHENVADRFCLRPGYSPCPGHTNVGPVRCRSGVWTDPSADDHLGLSENTGALYR